MQLDVHTIASSFGGGWVTGETETGLAALEDFFGEEPAPLAPLGDALGYIVEPQEADDLALHLRRECAAFGPPQGK